MLLSELINSVICAAKKGSHIASIIRSNNELLKLLVQEKSAKEKNERFVTDFKTLADVLIQEMVRHDLSAKFPGVEESIYGEENNTFTNTLGETITLQLGSTQQQTKQLLLKVLDGNTEAADVLSHCLHNDITTDIDARISDLKQTVNLQDIGIWIDPIDSTAQYIQGDIGEESKYSIAEEGLQCVTVLVGVFSKSSGLPIFGVAIQPYGNFNTDTKLRKEEVIWGLCYEDNKLNSFESQPPTDNNLVLISSSESDVVKQKLSSKYNIAYASGAGYKLICTAKGLANAYVLSKKTIFKWDCCGPHAILLSTGGGVVCYSDIVKKQDLDTTEIRQISYPFAESNDFDGIIAYSSKQTLLDILQTLQS